MSWHPARQVYDGNKNTFQNIPPSALASQGKFSASSFLPGETATQSRSTPIVMTIDSTQVQIITDNTGVVFDCSAMSAKQTALASGTPFTWMSGGGTAGAYGIVFVPCTNGVMDLGATAAVTWGGVAMTSLGTAYNNASGTTQGWGWVFGLNGIPGGNQPISVTLTQSGQTFTGYGSSYSYNNVTSVGALQTARGSSGSGNPAVAVTAANTTDIVWGAVSTNNVLLTGFSLTTRQQATIFPDFWAGDTTGSTGVTVGGTAAAQWSAFGLDLIGVTGGQTIQLPTTSVQPGYEYVIVNQMTASNVTVQASGGSTIAILAPNEIGVFTAGVATPTTNLQWAADVRLESVSFKVKTNTMIITTAGTSVVYTLPASSSTLLASGGALGTPSSGNLANCTGLPGFQPWDYGTPPWIDWAFDLIKAYLGSTATTAGQMYFVLVPIRQAATITNVILNVGTAGATLTSGQNFAGLFNSSGTLLSATADQSTNWQSTGVKTMALTAAQAVTAGFVYVAFFANGTTPPKFSVDGAANGALGALATPRQGVDTTHTGRTTSFFSPATLANNSTAYYWAAVS